MDLEYKGDYQLKLEKLKKLSLEPKTSFNKVSCPSCATETPATDLNINDKIAKCGACNIVFSFQETVNNLFTNSPKVKQEIIRPEGIDLFYFKDELSFALQQPNSGLVIALGIFSFSLAFFFTTFALFNPKFLLIIGSLISWSLGAYSIYSWKIRSKNKIYVNVKKDLLTVEWHPRNGNKDQKYNKQDIDQFYVAKAAYYEVRMVLNSLEGQKHICLIPGLDNLSKARYLEQEIEKHLSIIDRDVLEEIRV